MPMLIDYLNIPHVQHQTASDISSRLHIAVLYTHLLHFSNEFVNFKYGRKEKTLLLSLEIIISKNVTDVSIRQLAIYFLMKVI